MSLLDCLNENQKEAVITTEGPVMVMAGAGSGKTRVLTHRIAYLINDLGIPSQNILAVTFTNKAAREMKERITTLTNQNTNAMWVSTFHSFCARFLRIELDSQFGYRKEFTIVDEEDSLKIIRQILKDDNVDQKEYKPKLLKSLISKLKNRETVSIEEPFLKKYFDILYKKYNQALLKDNLLDFDDLILVTTRLFEEYPSLLEKYQRKFMYIMIDEFQDTNLIQYHLMKMLALRHHNIFIVGDQDQSIYSFRGAKVENIEKFQNDFLETKIILLEENYRSTKPILDIANKVIANNVKRIPKNLYTNAKSEEKPVYFNASTSYDEVMFVIDKIRELHTAGYSYNDFAILYRANHLSRQFEDMLIRYQIPYVIYGGLSFFERKEIKDMIAYLRLIINNDDDFSFKRIVNEPRRKIGDALIDKLTTEAGARNISLFKAIDFIPASGIGYSNLIMFKFMILELYEYLLNEENEFIDILDQILDKSGYASMLKNEGEEGKDRLDNIKELKTVLKEANEYYEGTRINVLQNLLSDLALRTDTDYKKEDEDTVKLMTFHQAKGLEYKAVFMVAMEQGLFPSMNCTSFDELEEERRICYVGITRAKEKLYLSNSNSRFMFGRQAFNGISTYIKEIGLDNLNVYNKVKEITPMFETYKKEPKVEETLNSDIIGLNDKINHKLFGDGVVVAKDGKVITVAFAQPHGIKKLMADHPSIRKI